MNHIETADLVARHTAKILLLIGYLAVLPATMAWSLARWFEPDTMHFLGLGWLVWASVAGERNRDKFALRTLTPAPIPASAVRPPATAATNPQQRSS